MRTAMNILGISAFYHDSAACLVQDGRIVAAAQEERFSRRKHDDRFPQNALDYCLREGGITAADLDHVAFYDKPLLKFDRLLETYLAFAPRGFRSFCAAMPLWLRVKLHLPHQIDRGLGRKRRTRYVFPEHHESHAASAFFPSPFEEAAILTMDGVGEWATAAWGVGRGNRIELRQELRFPHSLGLLYSAFTYFTGFKVNSGEYKLMGLAPYGRPRYKDAILENLIDLKDDGSFRMDQSYFNYCQGLVMTSRKFERLFGGPPRKAESALTEREMDLAASVQAVTEEIMLRAARHVARRSGLRNLVLAGGVALNCVANGRIVDEGIFDGLWIQPAAGDAGGALGAALFVWHQLLGRPREADGVHDRQDGSLLGPRYTSDEIRKFLDGVGAKYHPYTDEAALLGVVADAIASGKVVGWLHGRMEFGPRALGSRSILGDARSPEMQSIMNLKTKFRESFRPFAPSVLAERAAEWFLMQPGRESPYMLLVAGVRPEKRLATDEAAKNLAGIDRLLKAVRSVVPAITHVDYSARVQTVDEARHGRYWRLIRRFEEKTGCPVIINTSFNVRGEPIVCSPEDAWRCFMATNMDVLVLEDAVLYKDEQPAARQHEADRYLAQFALD
ncbi:MAG: carbamoyltransferase [Planctomycetota bacterium]|nr:carbamoyltransferase [Planctomycetota bacterium]